MDYNLEQLYSEYMSASTQDERDIVFGEIMHVLAHVVWKIYGKYRPILEQHYTRSEIYETLQYAIWQGIRTYNPAKGTKINTHIINHLRWSMGVLNNAQHKKRKQLDAPSEVQDSNMQRYISLAYAVSPIHGLVVTLFSNGLSEKAIEKIVGKKNYLNILKDLQHIIKI